MVLMLLLICYLFLSTRSLTLALYRQLGRWLKPTPFQKRTISHAKSNYQPVFILVTLDKVLSWELSRTSALWLFFFDPVTVPVCVRIDGAYCCEAVLVRLIKDWRNALDKKCVVGAVSMDMSTARPPPRQAGCIRCCSSQSASSYTVTLEIGPSVSG